MLLPHINICDICKEKTFQQGLFVGHGHSNSFDRMIALEPFRRSASGRNKLLTYLLFAISLRSVGFDYYHEELHVAPACSRRS